MKNILALFITLALAATAFAVEIGKPAPDFSGTDINGKTVKLSDYKGKIVVIESYNSDCPFYKTTTRPARCRNCSATSQPGTWCGSSWIP